MLDFEKIVAVVKQVAPDVQIDLNSKPHAIVVSAVDLLKICTELYQNSTTYFDMLSCISGIDNGVEANTMEVVYHLYSIPFDHSITIKVILPRDNPKVDSVSTIWRAANWLERETFDMYGIYFKDHPDLRRILMPADWEGYPLRKDYKHQDLYRGIKVEY